jgi:hypothetical protein
MIDMDGTKLEPTFAPKVATAQVGQRMKQGGGIQATAEGDDEGTNLRRQRIRQFRVQQ